MQLQRSMKDKMRAVIQAGLELPEDMREHDLPTQHHFAPGMYARELFIPTGVCVIGKKHLHSHLNTLSQGKVLVATEHGVVTLTAPFTFTSPAGTQRVIVALAGAVWTTYHLNPSDTEDLDVLEAKLIEPESQVCLGC